jgi:HEAT repeat protein
VSDALRSRESRAVAKAAGRPISPAKGPSWRPSTGGETAEEAALALGGSRRPEAFAALREWCDGPLAGEQRAVAFRALALLRREEAFDLLIEQVGDGSPSHSALALAALAVWPDDEAPRARVWASARGRDELAVQKALREAFGRDP